MTPSARTGSDEEEHIDQRHRIVDLNAADQGRVEQAARLLLGAFRDRSAAWPDIDSARQEVLESLEPGRISRLAIDNAQNVLGWIGGQPQYDGAVWELHPLVVAPHVRRRGIGRALVEDLEKAVVERGALTLWLGSDDEIDETSLSRVDLYDDLPAKLASFSSGGDHPADFYRRLGFSVVGVMPDANGRGKPDIFFAKRVGK
ncbi:MAG TPA: GNAT family N-acetyltransferase [Gemmatimonadaceae bacterium]|nr:GNAT family N-acetyltransferase [Gemmatimonadaceae bacterium]